ncbi:hypothetical protein PENSPDRAFT_685780 [Peniophora sp. CONT]|nr:hypothetical protein PENSPDRAFT_685780 [Peniophora sp. CONT]
MSKMTSERPTPYVNMGPSRSLKTSMRRVRLRRPMNPEVAKDALLFSLQALSESADAFPPLKSTVCGLLFLARQVELMDSNKASIVDIYAQIDAFASSLVHAIPDATSLSPAHEIAICALANDLNTVCADLEDIKRQRPILCFLRAKRHSGDLQELMRRLDRADASFTVPDYAGEREEFSTRLEIAAFAFLLYDYLLTLPTEVTHLWHRPLSRASLLFFSIRYVPILASLVLIILGHVPVFEMSCETYEWCMKIKLLVTQIYVCILMGVRVAAMYYNKRSIVLLVITVSAALLGASIAIIVYKEHTTTYTFAGLGVRQCQTALYDKRDAYAWITQAIFDIFVLVLTVVRTFANWREDGARRCPGSGRGLADLMFRDGIVYYLVITLATVANILTFFFGPPLARGCLSTLASAISTAMLARLTLHLHAAVARTSRSSRSIDLDILDALNADAPITRDLEMLDINGDGLYGSAGVYISAPLDSPDTVDNPPGAPLTVKHEA